MRVSHGKLGRNDAADAEIPARICRALRCDDGDGMGLAPAAEYGAKTHY